MIIILIITNLIFLGGGLYFARKSWRKSFLLKADRMWVESFCSGCYAHKENPGQWYSLREATIQQKPTNECERLNVPQPIIKQYIPESWREE